MYTPLVARMYLHRVHGFSEKLLMRKMNRGPICSSHKGLPFMSFLKRLGDTALSFSDLGVPTGSSFPVWEAREVPGGSPSGCMCG